MHPFSNPWKHKTVRFSDVFREVEKGCIGNKWFNIKQEMVKASQCQDVGLTTLQIF